jgi:hypothetical protein
MSIIGKKPGGEQHRLRFDPPACLFLRDAPQYKLGLHELHSFSILFHRLWRSESVRPYIAPKQNGSNALLLKCILCRIFYFRMSISSFIRRHLDRCYFYDQLLKFPNSLIFVPFFLPTLGIYFSSFMAKCVVAPLDRASDC